MSMIQAERRLADFTAEDANFDITETLSLSIDSLRSGGGTITFPIEYAEAYIYTDLNKVEMVPAGQRDGQGVITFADAPTGKHHRRAATPRGDNRSALMRPELQCPCGLLAQRRGSQRGSECRQRSQS